jgi:biopolymer transport protein ExbD
MEYSAQRVRAKTRAAVKRREDAIETDEMESGELNLIPYLDMVTNLMLFLLASVSAGIILAQIDTTLPDRAPPGKDPPKPDEEPKLQLFVSVKRDEIILWSVVQLEAGSLTNPRPNHIFRRAGFDGQACDANWMCETNFCNAKLSPPTCTEKPKEMGPPDDRAPVFNYKGLNDALLDIANRRLAGKARKIDSYAITLQADQSIPYATVVSIMSSMRCKLPDPGKEPLPCALPSEDEALKKAAEPIGKCGVGEGKCYDTTRAVYDPKTMALFHDIRFSSGFE